MTVDWATLSPAAQPAPPNLCPSTSPRMSITSKHHPTVVPREMETQTLNLVSTDSFINLFILALLQQAKVLFYMLHFNYFSVIFEAYFAQCNLQVAICVFRQ